MKFTFKNKNASNGQTLIETLVAIFVLVTGVTAALGLAVYALGTSTGIVKQIVATGLAREGLEAVKQMRDTNWLQQGVIDKNCYNYTDGSLTGWCYTHWLNQQFCLDPSSSGCDGALASANYILNFDQSSTTATGFWSLKQQTNPGNYGLLYDSTNTNNSGFYYSSGNGSSCSDSVATISDFCRKITITKITDKAPYLPGQSDGPLVLVQSYVWWVDRRCPRASDFNLANQSCRLEMDMYLTNWKDY